MYFSKKILYGSIGFVVLSTVIFGIYLVFFSKAPSDTISEDNANVFPLGGEGREPGASENFGGENISQEDIDAEMNYVPMDVENKTYKWQYGGRYYTIYQNLYSHINDYYKSQPKEYVYFKDIPVGTEDEYFGKFLIKPEEDDFFNDYYGELASAIVLQGKNNNLSEDQIVEMAVAFAQYIPYDDSKAAHIRMKTAEETINYPYETLFSNTGVSFDKSLLLVGVLRELGYGAAIFTYNATNHMAAGIQCPIAYSDYGSGYCFAETTNTKSEIGTIPELDSYAGKAVVSGESAGSSQAVQPIALGSVRIYQKTKGKEYRGIVASTKTNNVVASLEKEISSLKEEIEDIESDLSDSGTSYGKAFDFQEESSDLSEDVNECIRDAGEDSDEIQECLDNMYDEANDMNGDAEDDKEDWTDDYMDKIHDYGNLLREYNEKMREYNSLTEV